MQLSGAILNEKRGEIGGTHTLGNTEPILRQGFGLQASHI